MFGSIAEKSAAAEADNAVDFGDDIGQMMGDEEDAESGGGEFAGGVAEFGLGAEVEGVGGFVEDEGLGVVDEGAGDDGAADFAGRHFVDGAIGEMGDVEEVHQFTGAGVHFGGDVMVGPDADGGEEAGEDGFADGVGLGALGGEVVGDDAEEGAEVKDVPGIAAEDAHFAGGRGIARVEFAGDGLDEGGFAAAVGAEDGDVFAKGDGEGDVFEAGAIAAEDGDVAKFEEGGGHGQTFRVARDSGNRRGGGGVSL